MDKIIIQLIGEDGQKCRVWLVASKITCIGTNGTDGTYIAMDNEMEYVSNEPPEQFLLRLQALSIS